MKTEKNVGGSLVKGYGESRNAEKTCGGEGNFEGYTKMEEGM